MLQELIVMQKVNKYFNGKCVIKDIDYKIYKGKVHALIGPNGSGKTTLMKILAGIYKQDDGDIFFQGDIIEFNNPLEAQKKGIEMIFHEGSLFQELNIYQNMFINREPMKKLGPVHVINWKKIRTKTISILKQYQLDINPSDKVKTLAVATQRILEIVRALIHDAKLIIIDEPMVAMDKLEIDFLHNLINKMKKTGISVVYVSHQIENVFAIADYISVLRDGQMVATVKRSEFNSSSIIKMMARKELSNRFPKRPIAIGEEMLRVNNLTTKNLKNISFSIREGEIIGLAGLRGSHRIEVAKALFGIIDYKGDIFIKTVKKSIYSTEQAVQNGICYIGHGEKDEGIFYDAAVYANITAANTRFSSRKRKINKSFKKYISAHYIDLLDIRPSNIEELVGNLSAGNRKKVLLAKWLFSNSKIFIFNQPTANIDSSSKVDIYNIFGELLQTGASIIMISNDFSELIGMCDRIFVMNNGRIMKELAQNQATEELILKYASEENAGS
ncbi:MAG: ribose transport system ATP-binding protein [Clostridiales bacterium]|nr:ribose transport system ATP-binding protein [Clostridiales bacterium]